MALMRFMDFFISLTWDKISWFLLRQICRYCFISRYVVQQQLSIDLLWFIFVNCVQKSKLLNHLPPTRTQNTQLKSDLAFKILYWCNWSSFKIIRTQIKSLRLKQALNYFDNPIAGSIFNLIFSSRRRSISWNT